MTASFANPFVHTGHSQIGMESEYRAESLGTGLGRGVAGAAVEPF